jgi:hypothetical protein
VQFKVVTFADGGAEWGRAARRLTREASAFSEFSQVVTGSLASPLLGSDFKRQVPKDWLQANHRGSGYWIWKPYLIREALRNLGPKEEGVLYLDAGCTLNWNTPSVSRLHTYLEKSLETGTYFFELSNQLEISWTKHDVVRRFLPDELLETQPNQRLSTAHMWTPTERNFHFLDKWIEVARNENFRLLDDSPSINPESDQFIAHRHDQSIFSVLSKSLGYGSYPDETWHYPNWNVDGSSYPIWASRNRSGVSQFEQGVSATVRRLVYISMDRLGI